MVRLVRLLFGWPVGILAGVVTVSVLVILILHEDSIQPFTDHKWAEDIISPPLAEGREYTQAVLIPDGLADKGFRLAIFFGSEYENSVGSVEVVLVQADYSQSRIADGIAPRPTLRKRFSFDGFSAGPAMLSIRAMPGNLETAPGVLCIAAGEGPAMAGAMTQEPLYLSIDWFKIVPGREKLSLVFPAIWFAVLWLLPFAGLIAIAWTSMIRPRFPPDEIV